MVARVYPIERRALANRLAGDAVQLSNIQVGHDYNILLNEVVRDLRNLKRELGV